MTDALKVGLIGAGRMARAHLAAYTQFPDRIKLNAVCDIDENAARQFAEEANVSRVFLDAEKMLEEADIDAVDICTVHDAHLPQVLAAASAGKHIFLEKAMGRNLEECYRMLEATDRAGVTFMVGQDLRYIPYTRAVKRLLQNRELGQVRAARCDSIMNAKLPCPPGHWMLDGEKAGGGVMITLTIHMIDLLRYYIGDVRSVSGVCKSVWEAMANGAEDIACATLEFENGAIGTAFSYWTVARSPSAIQYTLFGDDGTLYTGRPTAETRLQQVGPVLMASARMDKPEDEPINRFAGFKEIEPVREGLAGDNPFVNEILHFAECCQTGEEPISSGRDNLGTMKTIMGIYESARTGRTVELKSL